MSAYKYMNGKWRHIETIVKWYCRTCWNHGETAVSTDLFQADRGLLEKRMNETQKCCENPDIKLVI